MAFNFDARDVSAGLTTEEFVVRQLRETDVALDYEAVMASREHLRVWEQSTWPEDDFTIEANREDLTRHERLHDEGRAFTYTVMDPAETACLGCVYLFPTDARFLAAADVTPQGDDRWEDVDAAVYFWIRSDRPSTLDAVLLDTLRSWIDGWPIDRYAIVTNEQLTRQVEVIEAAGLELRFEIAEPDKPGIYRAYA